MPRSAFAALCLGLLSAASSVQHSKVSAEVSASDQDSVHPLVSVVFWETCKASFKNLLDMSPVDTTQRNSTDVATRLCSDLRGFLGKHKTVRSAFQDGIMRMVQGDKSMPEQVRSAIPRSYAPEETCSVVTEKLFDWAVSTKKIVEKNDRTRLVNDFCQDMEVFTNNHPEIMIMWESLQSNPDELAATMVKAATVESLQHPVNITAIVSREILPFAGPA